MSLLLQKPCAILPKYSGNEPLRCVNFYFNFQHLMASPKLFLCFIGICSLSLFFSCKNEPKEKENEFSPEKILIPLSYPPFEDSVIGSILQEVGLCLNSSDTAKADSLQVPPCRHDWFRVFRNRKDRPWADGFVVEVKEGIYSHTPRVLHLIRTEGKYRVTNDYRGELLEMRTTPEGNYDLIIRYPEPEIGTVAILHEWKVNHYEPVTVIEINDHFVKEEKMDSLNRLYIDHFAWGF